MPPLGRALKSSGWIWQPLGTHLWMNRHYARKVDPWGFDSSAYEANKYAHSLRLLATRTYQTGLEIGAAEGVFTRMLAPQCGSLLAIDVAEVAVTRARQRCADLPNVTVLHAALPTATLQGRFDLIVASDVLYFFPSDVLVDIVGWLEAKLQPGGVLFALHYRGEIGQPLNGDRVHDLLRQHLRIRSILEEVVENVGPGPGYRGGYNVSMFERDPTEA